MTKRLLAKQIPRLLFWVLLAALVAVRLVIALSQRVYLVPQGSPLDDMLMVRAATSITQGNWLGDYGAYAIAKNMGFALWLALLHTLKLPLLAANCVLWLACCGFAMRALRPVFSGNLLRLVLFAFLAFQPFSFAPFTLRAYRDAIYPAFCLLLFAGVAGLLLRAGQKRLRGGLLCALGAGVGLAGGWLLREDGIVLLIFAACALAAAALWFFFARAPRRIAKILLSALPFGVLGVGVLAFSAANYAHYGVFAVNDLTAGAYPSAYGAMVAVSQAESGHVPRSPVTRKAIAKLMKTCPTVAALEEWILSASVYNGFANPATGEYGGSFYYALRLAADWSGQTPTAPAAQAYWAQMAEEIAAAVARGELKSGTPSASVIPRWHASLLAPTAAELGRGFLAVFTFQDCNPRPQESDGSQESIDEVAAFLHSKVQQGKFEGTELPFYNVVQRAAFLLCDVLTWVYRILIWPLFALALVNMGRRLAAGLSALFRQRRPTPALLAGILLLGLLLSFLLRLVVAAYMEVAAYGIGTYVMYLSGGVPALLLFAALGAVAAPEKASAPRHGKRQKGVP